MSHKGYALEHTIEDMLLLAAGQQREQPLYSRSHRNPTSGAHRGAKGDVVSMIPWLPRQWVIECKHYRQQSARGAVYRLAGKDWSDAARDAASYGNAIPVFVFCFKGQRDAIYFVFRSDDLDPLAESAGLTLSLTSTYTQARAGKLHFSLAYCDLKKDLSVPICNKVHLFAADPAFPELACVHRSAVVHLLAQLKAREPSA